MCVCASVCDDDGGVSVSERCSKGVKIVRWWVLCTQITASDKAQEKHWLYRSISSAPYQRWEDISLSSRGLSKDRSPPCTSMPCQRVWFLEAGIIRTKHINISGQNYPKNAFHKSPALFIALSTNRPSWIFGCLLRKFKIQVFRIQNVVKIQVVIIMICCRGFFLFYAVRNSLAIKLHLNLEYRTSLSSLGVTWRFDLSSKITNFSLKQYFDGAICKSWRDKLCLAQTLMRLSFKNVLRCVEERFFKDDKLLLDWCSGCMIWGKPAILLINIVIHEHIAKQNN